MSWRIDDDERLAALQHLWSLDVIHDRNPIADGWRVTTRMNSRIVHLMIWRRTRLADRSLFTGLELQDTFLIGGYLNAQRHGN